MSPYVASSFAIVSRSDVNILEGFLFVEPVSSSMRMPPAGIALTIFFTSGPIAAGASATGLPMELRQGLRHRLHSVLACAPKPQNPKTPKPQNKLSLCKHIYKIMNSDNIVLFSSALLFSMIQLFTRKFSNFIKELFPFLEEAIETQELYEKQSVSKLLDGMKKFGQIHIFVCFLRSITFQWSGDFFRVAIITTLMMAFVTSIINLTAFACRKLAEKLKNCLNSLHLLVKIAGCLMVFLFLLFGLAARAIPNEVLKAFFVPQYCSIVLLCVIMFVSDIRLQFMIFAVSEVFILLLSFKSCTVMDILYPTFISNLIYFLVTLFHERDQRINFLLKNKIKKQKKLYKEFINCLRIPVLLYGKGQLKWLNKAARDIGFTTENFLELGALFKSADGISLTNLLDNMLINPDMKINDLNFTIKQSNQRKNFTVTAWISREKHSDTKTIAVTLKETTDTILLEEHRAKDKFKNMLLFSLSHELRTPLNGIKGILTNLNKSYKNISSTIRNQLKRAKCSCDFLGNQIDNILEYVLMVTEDFVIHPIPFSIYQMFEKIKKNIVRELDNKKLQVSVELKINKNVPLDIKGDDQRIKQVLMNLVKNAVKFTSKGIICLSASITPDKKLELSVADTGCGMPAEFLRNLFGVKSSDLTGDQPGLAGLGLTISQMICKKMGTELFIQSEENKGTEIKFCVDCQINYVQHIEEELGQEGCELIEEKKNKVKITQVVGNCNLRRKSQLGLICKSCQDVKYVAKAEKLILVVDDNELNRFVLCKMLERFQIRTLIAVNGLEAVNIVTKKLSERPDLSLLILMDLNMPVMDGITAGAQILKLRYEIRPKIVAVTAFAAEQQRKDCASAGFDMFLTKPVDVDRIKKAINLLNY